MIAPAKSEREIKIKDEKSLHSYQIKYSEPGTYGFVAETRPGYFAMYTDKKGRKRHSLKSLHTFIDNAASVESSMRSSQWVKTYVVCEIPSDNFLADLGLPFELVPEKDPTALNEGESISFTVMSDGKPYEGVSYWDATYGGFSTESEVMPINESKWIQQQP